MKQLKMLGLGVLTILLVAALGGAPSAMAEGTELCKTDETPCENPVVFVHEVTELGKRASLLTNLGNVECAVLFSGEVPGTATNGATLVSGKFTYTNCTLKGSACEVKEVSKGSSLSILKLAHETANVAVTSEFNVNCGASISCTFVEEGLKGLAKGPLLSTLENGEVLIEEATINKVTGLTCPKESKFDIVTTPLVETFISQGFRYCVRYENSRGRWLLGPSSTACAVNEGVQAFNYEMIWDGIPGLKKGAMLCVRDVGITYYLTISGATCGVKDKEPLGRYELAEVA